MIIGQVVPGHPRSTPHVYWGFSLCFVDYIFRSSLMSRRERTERANIFRPQVALQIQCDGSNAIGSPCLRSINNKSEIYFHGPSNSFSISLCFLISCTIMRLLSCIRRACVPQRLGFQHVLMSGSGSTIFCVGNPSHSDAWAGDFAKKWGAMVVDTCFINRPNDCQGWYTRP